MYPYHTTLSTFLWVQTYIKSWEILKGICFFKLNRSSNLPAGICFSTVPESLIPSDCLMTKVNPYTHTHTSTQPSLNPTPLFSISLSLFPIFNLSLSLPLVPSVSAQGVCLLVSFSPLPQVLGLRGCCGPPSPQQGAGSAPQGKELEGLCLPCWGCGQAEPVGSRQGPGVLADGAGEMRQREMERGAPHGDQGQK